MAKTLSARKRARQAIKRNARNRARREPILDIRREMKRLLAAGKADEAEALMSQYQSALDKAVARDGYSKNRAARLKKNMAKQFPLCRETRGKQAEPPKTRVDRTPLFLKKKNEPAPVSLVSEAEASHMSFSVILDLDQYLRGGAYTPDSLNTAMGRISHRVTYIRNHGGDMRAPLGLRVTRENFPSADKAIHSYLSRGHQKFPRVLCIEKDMEALEARQRKQQEMILEEYSELTPEDREHVDIALGSLPNHAD